MTPTPPTGASAPRAPRAGFSLPFETIYAPRRAFATVATAREWFPGVVVSVLLQVCGLILAGPALLHAFAAEMTALQRATPGNAQEIAAQKLAAIMADQFVQPIESFVFTAFVFTLLGSAGMPPLRAFATYFSLAANVGAIAGVGMLLFGAVIRAHDPASFGSFTDVILAVPDSLASFAPNGSPLEIGSLGAWDVFAFWTQIVLAYGFAAISGRALLPALGISFGTGLIFWLTLYNA